MMTRLKYFIILVRLIFLDRDHTRKLYLAVRMRTTLLNYGKLIRLKVDNATGAVYNVTGFFPEVYK